MTDAALENAVAARDEMAEKIAKAEEQIEEWRARLQRAERFIADWEDFSGQKAPRLEARPTQDAQTTEKKPKNPKKEDVAKAAAEIIREKGEPMTRDDLFATLQDKGVVIHGKNPPVVLQTMLWRMSHVITHLKGHGYWPADDDYAPAEYNVEDQAEIAAEDEEEKFQSLLDDIDQ